MRGPRCLRSMRQRESSQIAFHLPQNIEIIRPASILGGRSDDGRVEGSFERVRRGSLDDESLRTRLRRTSIAQIGSEGLSREAVVRWPWSVVLRVRSSIGVSGSEGELVRRSVCLLCDGEMMKWARVILTSGGRGTSVSSAKSGLRRHTIGSTNRHPAATVTFFDRGDCHLRLRGLLSSRGAASSKRTSLSSSSSCLYCGSSGPSSALSSCGICWALRDKEMICISKRISIE